MHCTCTAVPGGSWLCVLRWRGLPGTLWCKAFAIINTPASPTACVERVWGLEMSLFLFVFPKHIPGLSPEPHWLGLDSTSRGREPSHPARLTRVRSQRGKCSTAEAGSAARKGGRPGQGHPPDTGGAPYPGALLSTSQSLCGARQCPI